MGRLIVFTDLDDTLFSSERSGPGRGQFARTGALNADGDPICFQSTQQMILSRRMIDTADCVVPVTGRTSRALVLQQIIEGYHYSIASHGAWVMEDTQGYPPWLDHIEHLIDDARHALGNALAEVERLTARSIDLRCRIHHEGDNVPVYISIKKDPGFGTDDRQQLAQLAADHGLYLHIAARNAALLPSYASKRQAVEFLCDQVLKVTPQDMLLTIGDSASDRDFMGVGDFALCPTQSPAWHGEWTAS